MFHIHNYVHLAQHKHGLLFFWVGTPAFPFLVMTMPASKGSLSITLVGHDMIIQPSIALLVVGLYVHDYVFVTLYI